VIDQLTGARARGALVSRINHELLTEASALFVARFLCVDIDNLKAYLDVEGLTAGDDKLIALGRALIEHYGVDAVFRVDGDDFVVELGDREPWIPRLDGIAIKHAILDVALHRHRARNHHVRKWIMMHIDAASLAARVGGTSLSCGDPPGLAA